MKRIRYTMARQAKRYLIIALASVLAAAAVNLFLIPHQMLSGGLSGIAIILYLLFKWPVGLLVGAMNVPLFIASYRLLDTQSVIIGLYGMFAFSFSLDATAFLVQYKLTDDILLAALCGGAASGFGYGLVFRSGGNGGGADLIAILVKKYYAFDIGAVIFVINFILMTTSAFLFGFKPAMYTLLSMYVTSAVTDKVIEGFNRKKTVTIISDECVEIANVILDEIGRGVTFLHGEGAFTQQERKVILVVVTLTQVAKIKLILENIDPKAFMFIQDAAEVSGRGFTLPLPKRQRIIPDSPQKPPLP